jgi:hypothetical protein
MTQVHRARTGACEIWGRKRLVRYSRVVFAKYVPFRFYAGSRVMLQKRICKRSLALGDQLRRFRRFGFVESSVPLREE